MHKVLSSAFGFVALVATTTASQAVCSQIDIGGTWQAYGTAEAGTSVAGRCVLRFNSLGFLATTSKCSFRDNVLDINVTVGVTGSLHLKNGTNCIYEGIISISSGTYNDRSASLSAGLSRDKTILVATGTVINELDDAVPNGAVSFTALKP